jgi:hypothetical protein
MEAIRLQKRISKDGEVSIKGLPLKKGTHVELILIPTQKTTKNNLTASKLLKSDVVGIWKYRKEIRNSSTYANQLRKESQTRRIKK